MVKLSISGILGIILLLLLSGCSQGDLAGEAFKKLKKDSSDESGGSGGGGGSSSSSNDWKVGSDEFGRYLYPKMEENIRFRSVNSEGYTLSILSGGDLKVGGRIVGGDGATINDGLIVTGKVNAYEGFCSNDWDHCIKSIVNNDDIYTWTFDSNLDIDGAIVAEHVVINDGLKAFGHVGFGTTGVEQKPILDTGGNDEGTNLVIRADTTSIFSDRLSIEGKVQIDSLGPDQGQASMFEVGQTAAYACIDSTGQLFRSYLPCTEHGG